MINVDLLVGDPHRGVLLAWRDDPYCGRGWHIPGGIIRFKESIADRIQQVALHEIGAAVAARPGPIAVHEIIEEAQRDRAHFISLLYRCDIEMDFHIENRGRRRDEPGFLAWHTRCPNDLLPWHDIYRPQINAICELIGDPGNRRQEP